MVAGTVRNYMKQAMRDYKARFEASRTAEDYQENLENAIDCVKRYFYLIVFNAYLNQNVWGDS